MFTTRAVALPLKQRAKSRRLVIVDIENVVGGAVLDLPTAERAWECIAQAAELCCYDHVVMGASHISAIAAWRGRPSARLVMRSGPDGADLALLQVLEEESIESRFDEVVVVSGDGIFADVVAGLGACGVRVTVVARRRCLARRLRMAAGTLVDLPDYNESMGDAA